MGQRTSPHLPPRDSVATTRISIGTRTKARKSTPKPSKTTTTTTTSPPTSTQNESCLEPIKIWDVITIKPIFDHSSFLVHEIDYLIISETGKPDVEVAKNDYKLQLLNLRLLEN
ncbi:14389_t:CDS:2 [Dentiscutata heterogama]|uniref:14389_t:CDS:1 n=1 Tax=Dentiscutata heterogama TaxID=1316150 RepID=A0ACA9JUX7_9GLOM|nr:14389_t:CDS:2 [Dentiscutata heterogama]